MVQFLPKAKDFGVSSNQIYEFYGILKGFYPRLETSQNGKKHVVWIANIEPTHKIMQDKEWVDDGGSASFNFTAPTKDIKIKELLGL